VPPRARASAPTTTAARLTAPPPAIARLPGVSASVRRATGPVALSPEGAPRRAEAARALVAAAERDREAGRVDAAHANLDLARRLAPDEAAIVRAREALLRAPPPPAPPARADAREALDAAIAHRAAGRHAEAIAALEASIAAEPSPAALHALAALVAAQLHDDARATKLLLRAAALAPDHGTIAAALARLTSPAPGAAEPPRPSVGVLERWARAIER
jgi:tetratricopeptide (TPR) repeat protein